MMKKKSFTKVFGVMILMLSTFFIFQSFTTVNPEKPMSSEIDEKLNLTADSPIIHLNKDGKEESELVGNDYCKYRLSGVTSFVNFPDPTPVWLKNGGIICTPCTVTSPPNACPTPTGNGPYRIMVGSITVGSANAVVGINLTCKPCGRFEGRASFSN